MEKRGSAAKYPLRRRLSAASGSKIVSVYDGAVAVDFADRAKKPRRWQEEEDEEEVVVEGPERQKEASDGHRASRSSPDVDTEEKTGASEMVDVSEGEEATRHPKRVTKIHNHGKALDDCNTVDPAPVPRKLRSAMNKRNRESISPPLPESKKCNGSNGSRLTPLGYSNGTKKSRQSLKQANAMDRSPRKAVPIAVTKTEEEVAEALYDLSRMFTGSPVRSTAGETEIEEIKPLPSPEERTKGLPLDSPAEDTNKREHEMVDASADDVLKNPVEVKPCADTIVAQLPAVILVPEKLDLESHVQLVQHNNTQFEKKPSVLPLTDVSNVLVPPRGDSEKGLIQPPISDLLPPDQAEKGPLQSEIFVTKRLEPSENPDKCASLGSMPGVAPFSSHNVKSGSHIGLDLSGPSSTKTTALGDSTRKLAKSAVSTGKCLDSAKQTWKRCAIHVRLSRFIRCHQNDSKLPKWGVLSWQQPSMVNGDAQKSCTSAVYNHSISSIPTADSTERNPKSGCLQLLQEKIPALDGVHSREIFTEGVDFLSLSPSDGDGSKSKLRTLNSGVVESTLPVPSSFMGSVQHQPPFSIQPAQLHTAYTDQQLAVTAAQQVQFQVQLPQYIANPFLNPHFATAAAAAGAAATTPAGKQQQQQQQQLWVSQMAQFHRAAQFPKWSNGINEVASLLPSSQPGPSLDPLSNTYIQSQQLFPLTSAQNKSQQQPQLRQQIFRSEGQSQLQLLRNGDRT